MVVMTACVMSVVGWGVVAWGGVVQLRSFFFHFLRKLSKADSRRR